MAENDIQKQTDVNQAKERLEQVARNRGIAEGGERTPGIIPAAPGDKSHEKIIRPVNAKPKKKGFGQKLKEAFFGDIGDGSITEHILFRIFIPSLKRVISDMGTSALNMALGLDVRNNRTSGVTTHVANASVYRDRNYNRSASVGGGYSRREAISELEWDEETAKDIYNQMSDLIEQFRYCNIADVYSIMGLESKIRSTDKSWGWTSMRNVEVYSIDPEGTRWIIDVPPAKPIPDSYM